MTTPLAGYTVGVTAARRADELGALLARRGATVQFGPAIRLIPLADDEDLLRQTEAVIDSPPDVVVATTGIGFRGWVEAAEGWGLGDALLAALGRATVLTRGPKAKGAVRAAGLVEAWAPASEGSAELLDYLLAQGVAGKRGGGGGGGGVGSWAVMAGAPRWGAGLCGATGWGWMRRPI
ncbi:uroporphyrinogen-III synthase, partial [Actinophytocola sp. NPDC049390]|uniref:uroporphyrinogen-III synthase n=1 Tax=Actinophytocola sp. NPDC049390 TaxID=3363894 RepID=UPI0037A242E8